MNSIFQSYEITDLYVRTANENYKTLPNKYQLTSTTKTTVTEIIPFHVLPTPCILLKLEDLNMTNINSVVGKLIFIFIDIIINVKIVKTKIYEKHTRNCII